VSLEHVDVVLGSSIVRVPAAQLRARAAEAARVVVDVGAGDGRLAYRLARAHTDWLCMAVDACAAGMQRLSWRAQRKTGRGGAPNAVFIRAAAESLPDGLAAIADEVSVCYPWGSLLQAVIRPDDTVLRRIARVGRPGAALRIRVNVSALIALTGRVGAMLADGGSPLRSSYAAAGIRLDFCGQVREEGETSWGARLHGGRPATVLAIDGTVLGRAA
jgi:16S rRNA (adenine(1408)-N(1))-methyltransferase